jgi:hypothetical protein
MNTTSGSPMPEVALLVAFVEAVLNRPEIVKLASDQP